MLCVCFPSLFLFLCWFLMSILGTSLPLRSQPQWVSQSASYSPCLWSGCDSSWACIPSFEDLGPPHDELAPVTHSALQWRHAFQEEKRQNLPLTAASPVVARPPPGGSCQVLLLGSPGLPVPSSSPSSCPCLVSGGQQFHWTNLWVV